MTEPALAGAGRSGPSAAASAGAASVGSRPALGAGRLARLWEAGGPVLAVLLLILVAWYAGAVMLNRPQVEERLTNLGEPYGWQQVVDAAWAMDRPVLPAPHQVAANWWASTFEQEIDSPRSLVFHAGVTLQATLLGFALGMTLGVLSLIHI